jgi:peroxiredoxin Q/BCP
MALDVGAHLPEFTLPADGGQTVSSASLKGRMTVLYFYPKDDTPGCTKEAQSFRDALDAFQSAGINVIGVSTDSVASHDKFKNKHGINFPLISDTNADLAKLFGVWVEKSMYGKRYMGVERATFLIDIDGVIRHVWRKVKVEGHAASVLAAVRHL